MAYCDNCGAELAADVKFCHECGAPGISEASPTSKEASGSGFQTELKPGIGYGTDLENLPEGFVLDDRYEIKAKVGHGGFGAVYRAYDRKMDIDKALKVLPRSVAEDKRSLDSLLAEARTMAKLNHPHIVRLYEIHDSGLIKYLDMEYVAGGSLADRLFASKSQRFSEGEAKKIAIQIAEGLAYAHSQGVIHKDIKPQNILIADDGTAKVMDFGISETVRTSLSRLSNTTSSGTLVYMSPEQIRGKDVGKEADIYSFGAMLYELLCGHPPFHKGDIHYQILNEPPETIAGVSGQMNAFLLKCLAKDYKERYRSFEEVGAVLKGGKAAARAAEGFSPSSSSGKNSRRPLWAMAGVLVLLAVIGTLAVLFGPEIFLKKGPAPVAESVRRPIPAARPAYPRLDPGGGTGVFYVKSDPDGAAVTLNGRNVGKTPYRDETLPAGVHLLRLELTDYKPLEQEVTVARDEVWNQTLPLVRGRGKYIITTDPPEADIYLDGQKQGISPLSVEAESGRHALRAVKGEKAGETDLSVGVEESVRVSLALDRVLFQGKVVTADEKQVILEKERAEISRHLSEGKSHLQTGQWDKAIVAFKAVLALESGHREARSLLARAEQDKKDEQVDRFLSNLGMKFVYIKPGSFMMGSPASESGRDDDERRHRVTLSRGFYMQTTEVTQGQWRAIMGGNPSHFSSCGDNCPVEKVSWDDTQEFIRKLNQRTGRTYRLPTEAEWEYACRAGSSTRFCFGDSDSGLGRYAWYYSNAGRKTHPVARKRANAWGLYDMHGNVWEWCSDRYDKNYPSGSVTDPTGPSSGTSRVKRGGSWSDDARSCRSANRIGNDPSIRYFNGGGFRLVLLPGQ